MAKEISDAERTVQIVSDGTPRLTHVLGPDGQEIRNVRSFTIHAEARDDFVVVNLEIRPVSLDVHALVNEVLFSCPFCSTENRHKCSSSNHTTETP